MANLNMLPNQPQDFSISKGAANLSISDALLDPNDPLATSQNGFNETLSSFFAPYGIDVSHFPMTNPPIFESALYNTEVPKRRRISISNGQIGQIITSHNLDNDDLYDQQPPPYPRNFHTAETPVIQLQTQQPQTQSQTSLYDPAQGASQNNVLLSQQEQQQQQINNQINNHINNQIDNQIQAQVAQAQAQAQVQAQVDAQRAVLLQKQQQQAILLQQQQQQEQSQPAQQQLTSQVKQENTDLPVPSGNFATNNQGIPSGKLLYNNEVIFNPDAGPIPGTAAWKKARLLERNRIAASKCRQRKKAAQMQLREEVNNYEKTISDLKHERDTYAELYEAVKNSDIKDSKILQIIERIEKLKGGE